MRDVPQPNIDPKLLKATADGLVSFAANLYSRLNTASGNLLISPYSYSTYRGS